MRYTSVLACIAIRVELQKTYVVVCHHYWIISSDPNLTFANFQPQYNIQNGLYWLSPDQRQLLFAVKTQKVSESHTGVFLTSAPIVVIFRLSVAYRNITFCSFRIFDIHFMDDTRSTMSTKSELRSSASFPCALMPDSSLSLQTSFCHWPSPRTPSVKLLHEAPQIH